MPSYKLKLNVGDGLGFTPDNKLTVKYVGDNIHIVENESVGAIGLYVDRLNGPSGSVPDNWSLITGIGSRTSSSVSPAVINNFIDIDRDVVNLIFTYGLYVAAPEPGGRNATTITYTSTVKSAVDIMNEMNFPLLKNGQNRTSYRPNAGELIQLVLNPTFRSVYNAPNIGGNIATEDGTRAGNSSMTTKVLFMINEILYASDVDPNGNAYWVNSMTLTCLYSEVPEYVVGDEYRTQQQ